MGSFLLKKRREKKLTKEWEEKLSHAPEKGKKPGIRERSRSQDIERCGRIGQVAQADSTFAVKIGAENWNSDIEQGGSDNSGRPSDFQPRQLRIPLTTVMVFMR